ncbi:MAG: preprotein translocase subunit YajC [Bacteroidota bacterium]
MNTSLHLLLSSSGGDSTTTTATLLLWGMIFVVAYFFLIRPQAQKTKNQRSFIEEMAKGDRVVTNGGIHGKVVKIEEKTVVIAVDNKTNITLEKSAINHELTQAASKTEA